MSQLTTLERFWSKVDCSGGPNACWPWMATCKGYGQFRADGKMHQAHRWILSIAVGRLLHWDDEIREEACHRCNNMPCCNPAHLYVGDRSSNMRDCVAGGKHASASKTHCPKGHVYIPENICCSYKTGYRSCKICARERMTSKRRVAGAQTRQEYAASITHCPQGHAYDKKNTYMTASGSRYCRECNKLRARARYAAKKAA